MNRLIKAVHHITNVSREAHPPSLDKITNNLATIIKPASPNLQTQTLIDGNARNWAFTTVLILREHYQKNIDSEMQKLTQFPSPDWRGPFEIATTWAKRNLGRRLRQDTIDRAQAVIIARTTETAPPAPLPAAAVSSLPTQTADQTAEEDPHAVIELAPSSPPVNQPPSTRPPSPAAAQPPPSPQSSSHQITTIAQIHAAPPPAPISRVSVETMTEPQQEDWSPLFDLEEASETELSPPTSPSRLSPVIPLPPRINRSQISSTAESVVRVLDMQKADSEAEEEITLEPEPADEQITALSQRKGSQRSSHREGSPPPPVQTSTMESRGYHTLTPATLSKLRSSVQSRLAVERAEQTTTSAAEMQVCAPTRHDNTPRKFTEWHLHIQQKKVIIGDSNISRLPPFKGGNVQLDSFPGARWHHAEFLLKTATFQTEPEVLLLSFGLNNRSQRDKKAPVKEMIKALTVAGQRFPDATIFVPHVSFSPHLSPDEKAVLIHLNQHIQELTDYIPPLSGFFETQTDSIHWTAATAKRMLEHWASWLN
ncbi:ras and Rab interactor 3-like [Oryzias latipes]|uniref:ras and Rab interactor 3-like n=1 Tax=Oryzias latipes TaxID=8090 RepID=UPI000CE2637A|nr:ras and Rab interactor 3-like [Oryzias latipes]